jgi:hypothetical protein
MSANQVLKPIRSLSIFLAKEDVASSSLVARSISLQRTSSTLGTPRRYPLATQCISQTILISSVSADWTIPVKRCQDKGRGAPAIWETALKCDDGRDGLRAEHQGMRSNTRHGESSKTEANVEMKRLSFVFHFLLMTGCLSRERSLTGKKHP